MLDRYFAGARGLAIAAISAAMSLLLCSCSVGPNYKRPAQDMPTTYKSATTKEVAEPLLGSDWWHLFGDDQLNALEAEAIKANTDVQVAIARVEAARAAAGVTKSQFFPTLFLDPSIQRGQFPVRQFGSSGSLSSGSISNSSSPHSETTTTVEIPFDLNYEVDIWGRIRREYESSLAQYQASADDYEVMLQTVEADVAEDYFNLRSLDDQDRILRETVDSYRTQVDLTKKQLAAGLLGRIDYVQALAQLDSTITQEQDIKRQRADQEHALAILIGRTPSELSVGIHPLDLTPPKIPAGLPSELLRRRPDVAEAEQNLVAANAQIGVAQAQFYPTVSLSGLAGWESFDLQHALDWENRIWSVGANASLPLFEGGLLTSQLQQAKAQYQVNVATYRGIVLGAIRDVEDSLTDLHLRADEAAAQERAVHSSREYLDLSQTEYRQGLIAYLEVIDAERTLLTNELSAAQILNERLTSTVLLIKALGGGWDAQAATAPAPPTLPFSP